MFQGRTLVMSLCMAGVLLWLAPAIRESLPGNRHDVPIVVSTWAFTTATDAAWAVLASAGTEASALAAVEEVCMHPTEAWHRNKSICLILKMVLKHFGWHAGLQHL